MQNYSLCLALKQTEVSIYELPVSQLEVAVPLPAGDPSIPHFEPLKPEELLYTHEICKVPLMLFLRSL